MFSSVLRYTRLLNGIASLVVHSVVGGKWLKTENSPYEHSIDAYGATITGIPSQISYGGWQKIGHAIPPWSLFSNIRYIFIESYKRTGSLVKFAFLVAICWWLDRHNSLVANSGLELYVSFVKDLNSEADAQANLAVNLAGEAFKIINFVHL